MMEANFDLQKYRAWSRVCHKGPLYDQIICVTQVVVWHTVGVVARILHTMQQVCSNLAELSLWLWMYVHKAAHLAFIIAFVSVNNEARKRKRKQRMWMVWLKK
jgi:hypothetical protein